MLAGDLAQTRATFLRRTEAMLFLGAMLQAILLSHGRGALQTEKVGGEGGDRASLVVGRGLGHDGGRIEDAS